MRAVVQCVLEASVSIDGECTAQIGPGYLVLLGVGHADTKETADKLWNKLRDLRICADEDGKTNLSIQDTHGAVLIVSQFTLYANCRRGRRPSFTEAALPEHAKALYEYVVERARADIDEVATGRFAADMKVSLINDGPFTVVLDTDEL
ncbi:D-tyrosyl-tRNA(Tyr) deacylase [Collinsella sp. zg1085]|uniref:D-aminoacyl-tRNA deacylase n=1 Tax=Collinsella sp. zg1085 TaxID=2844380 RepID=UPI001C0DEDC8|nr:D-aminoacyl-tRNA deacylase [Collinsella sp. zg1085]QWT17914.1 D-tyrosyl-tRNA(Tyr) deacylase [Collinsella sp. zg1085]